MKYLEIAKESIENLSLDEDDYIEPDKQENLIILGDGKVFFRSSDIKVNIRINFSNTQGCRVFIGRNVRGNIAVNFRGNNSLLYIGNGSFLTDLLIKSFQSDDFIAIGNQVTTTSRNVWASGTRHVWIPGNGPGKSSPAIIVGDDCMFAYDVVLRNTDGHPVYSMETGELVNEPEGIIHIEPHVWIGEQVSILKSVKVGACSIVALGSIVTKDIPRFSVARGAPAVAKVDPDIYWARDSSERAKNCAKYFVKRYQDS